MSSEIEALCDRLYYEQRCLEELKKEINDLASKHGYYSFINADDDSVEILSYEKELCADAHVVCWHSHCRIVIQFRSMLRERRLCKSLIYWLRAQLQNALMKEAAEKAKENQKE